MRYTTKEQAQRFAAAFAVAMIAVTLILPPTMHHAPRSVRESVFRIALLPAAAAWFLTWKMPGSRGLAIFRTIMLTIALVGSGGLMLHGLSALTSPWIRETVESARFLIQAGVYVGVGAVGLIGSLLIRDDQVSGA